MAALEKRSGLFNRMDNIASKTVEQGAQESTMMNVDIWKLCKIAGIDPDARAALSHATQMYSRDADVFREAIKWSVRNSHSVLGNVGEVDLFGETATVQDVVARAMNEHRVASKLVDIARIVGIELDRDEETAYEIAHGRETIAAFAAFHGEHDAAGPR